MLSRFSLSMLALFLLAALPGAVLAHDGHVHSDGGFASGFSHPLTGLDHLIAMLARLVPEPDWEGCLVYKGAAPDDSARMVCIGMSGPAAVRVQEKLVETFETTGIPVPTIYEGGPEPQLELARVTNGKWATP